MGLFNHCCVKTSVPPPNPALPRAQYPKQFTQPFLTKQLFAILSKENSSQCYNPPTLGGHIPYSNTFMSG